MAEGDKTDLYKPVFPYGYQGRWYGRDGRQVTFGLGAAGQGRPTGWKALGAAVIKQALRDLVAARPERYASEELHEYKNRLKHWRRERRNAKEFFEGKDGKTDSPMLDGYCDLIGRKTELVQDLAWRKMEEAGR